MDIEERIAAMAPKEPDVLVLYDAVKELQSSLHLPFDAELSLRSTVQEKTVLRRKFKRRNTFIYYNMAVDNFCYINAIQIMDDQYSLIYNNFVSAVYGFCDIVPSLKYRNHCVRGE